MFSFLKRIFGKKSDELLLQSKTVSEEASTVELNEWEEALFYTELKGKNHKQLHQVAFEQITETASFANGEREIFLELLWEQWETPINLKLFYQQVDEKIQDFEWKWFDEWEHIFSQKGEYPYVWETHRKKRKSTPKAIKIAVLCHSVNSRFAALRQYESHYGILENCTWSNKQFNLRLSILDDDIVEKEIVENMDIIQNNQIFALPPYIPSGRTGIIYERIRSK